jgi:mRNA interferase RelE/StbE
MYEIIFTDLAEKQFSKLDRALQERVIAVLERVRIRPEAYVKKLVGESSYRLRVSDYRVILEIEHDSSRMFVIKIGNRSVIYK